MALKDYLLNLFFSSSTQVVKLDNELAQLKAEELFCSWGWDSSPVKPVGGSVVIGGYLWEPQKFGLWVWILCRSTLKHWGEGRCWKMWAWRIHTGQVLPVYPQGMRNQENVSLSGLWRFQSCLGIKQLKECPGLHRRATIWGIYLKKKKV